MALPNWQATIQTNEGVVISGAEVQVVFEATGLDADIFSDRAGASAKSNPFFTGSDGFAEFYAAAGEYRITATGPSGSRTWRYEVLLGTATDNTWTGDQTFGGDNTFSGENTFTGQLPNFTGMIAPFATATPPTGWLAADGAAVSRTTYAALFTAIGTTWGAGDGSATFNVPDLREVAPVGIGTRGAGDAADVFTLGEFKDDQMQQITGVISETRNGGSGAEGAFTRGTTVFDGPGSAGGANNFRYFFDSANSPNARTGTTTRGKRVGVQYCIKF